MIKALVFHPRIVQALSLEELMNLREILEKYDLELFFVAESESKYIAELGKLQRIKIPLKDFVNIDKANNKKRGAKEWLRYISDTYDIRPNEIIYLGQSKLDWRTAVNSGAFYFHANFVRNKDYESFGLKSFSLFIRLVKIFWEMKDGLWGFSHKSGNIKLRFLLSSQVEVPVDGNKVSKLADILKEDYDKNHTIGEMPARNVLMFFTLVQLWLSGDITPASYFTFYPGHSIGGGNKFLETYFSGATRAAFKGYFWKNLLYRFKNTIRKHKARLEEKRNLVSFEKEFNTLCVKKETLRKRKDLNKKNVVIVDDFSTTGISLEAGRAILQLAGFKNIVLCAIGKYGGGRYNKYEIKPEIKTKIDPFSCKDRVSISSEDYSKGKLWFDEDIEAEKKFLEILRLLCK